MNISWQSVKHFVAKNYKPILAFLGSSLCIAIFLLTAAMWKTLGTTSKGERLKRNQASPQWKDGKFANPLPEKIFWKKMLGRYLKSSAHANPVQPIPVQKVDPAFFKTPPQSGLRVTWFGHSSVLVEIEGKLILIDPVWGSHAGPTTLFGPKRFHENPLPLDQLPKPDAVVLSHDHYDHLDHATILQLKDWDVPFIVPLGLGAHLEYWGVKPEQILEKDWWQEVPLGDLTLACLPARHFSGRGVFDRNKTLWSGWALIGKKNRLYYSGDTGMFEGFKDIGEKYGPFDASLIELGSYDPSWPDVHVGPEQAVAAHLDAKGGLFLPVHWSTFNLAVHGWTEPVERLLAAAKKAKVAVSIPRPGQSVEPAKPPKLERWWPDLPWETNEQSPVVSTGL